MKGMIKTIDFHYNVDLDYHTEYDCDSHGCHEEGICRCGNIEDAIVKELNIDQIIKTIFERLDGYNLSDMEKYCVERICIINKLYDVDNYEVVVCGGYYGDEIDGVYIKEDISKKIETEIQSIINEKNNKEKIERILEIEYGYIIDTVKKVKNYNIIKVKKSDIIISNEDYVKKIEKIKSYEKRELPIAVCIKKGNKYKVIDGHHRVLSNKNDVVSVVFGE